MHESFGAILTEAGRIAQNARKDLKIDLKPDNSIVTNGDKEAELYLRRVLPPLEPGASFWGEEGIFESPVENGYWLVDPIDGTSNYAYGSPLWGVSVAFYKNSHLQYGGVFLADLDELVIAENGKGATFNGVPIPKMQSGAIHDYELVACTESILRKIHIDQFPGKPRLSGAFVINGVFTALGRYRALLAAREKLYDVAACVVIGREVGSDVRYLDGEPFLESDLVEDRPVNKLWGMLPPGSTMKL